MYIPKQHLFVLGAITSGTSPICLMLNRHPSIFMTYEFLDNPGYREPDNDYLNLVNHLPIIDDVLSEKQSLVTSFMNAYEQVNDKSLKYIGDKTTDFYPNLIPILNRENHKVIFTIRNYKTWLIKVLNTYRHMGGEENDYPPHVFDDEFLPEQVKDNKNQIHKVTLNYVEYFLQSFKLKNCIYSSLDDFIYNRKELTKKIGRFLNLDDAEYYFSTDAIIDFPEYKKHYLGKWIDGHPSAQMVRESEDVVYLEKNHKFWDIVDPIFNKYYNNLDSSFSVEEIDEDINTLRSELDSFDELKLTDVYENFEIEKYTRVKNKRVWGKLQQSASELYTINKNVIRFDNGKYTINGEEVGDLLWREKMIFEGEQRKRHLIMEEQKRIKAELAKSASLDL
tara:strand:- start:898 stop:2076 length:1179 start_codon:yes stop_codon:yes gene_type:complete